MKSLKAAPKREVDFLQQVSAFFRIRFVTARQTNQSRTVFRCGLFVLAVLCAHI